LKDLLYRSFSKAGGDRLAWRLTPNSLRIICYHGVCDDGLAGEAWMPSYFVTRSAFEFQLEYLQRNTTVLALSDGVKRLTEGTLPRGAVSITFDDGYANNLQLAAPLLRQYGTPASIFLSTDYIETGELYPFLKLKFLRLAHRDLPLPEYKSSPVDTVRNAAAAYWPETEAKLTNAQRETLRPMTVNEVRALDSSLIELGAHSHTHAIARNETPERRRDEVQISVRKVAEWTGHPQQVFSYPNGEAGDFGDPEKQALRVEGVPAAVTGIGGFNRWPCDLFELKRYPVTLYHDESRFRAEVSGFRTMLLSMSGTRVL